MACAWSSGPAAPCSTGLVSLVSLGPPPEAFTFISNHACPQPISYCTAFRVPCHALVCMRAFFCNLMTTTTRGSSSVVQLTKCRQPWESHSPVAAPWPPASWSSSSDMAARDEAMECGGSDGWRELRLPACCSDACGSQHMPSAHAALAGCIGLGPLRVNLCRNRVRLLDRLRDVSHSTTKGATVPHPRCLR